MKKAARMAVIAGTQTPRGLTELQQTQKAASTQADRSFDRVKVIKNEEAKTK